MGGAMDLCSNPDETKIIVVTDHTDKSGRPKIVQDCTLPLTAARVASRIITDRAVFDVDRVHGGGLTLIELAEGETVESITNDTGAEFKVAKTLAQFK
jgi:3-oxoacid CoA-transferase